MASRKSPGMKSLQVVSILLSLTLGGCCAAAPPSTPTSKPSVAGVSTPAALASPATRVEPRKNVTVSFTLNLPGERLVFSREELLQHQAARTVTIEDGGAFKGQRIPFRAVPVTALFSGKELPDGLTVEFAALDGFSASLNPDLLLNSDPKGALAYLAVEEPDKPWPRLAKGGTAGPFYLIWENPQLSDVGQEQWPFQLASFSLEEPIATRFPALPPHPELPDDHPARRGFELFSKNCLACHTLNGQGSGTLGPDLNLPHSPTEYMNKTYLRKLVRDPQSLRKWKGSRMSSFSKEQLSDPELDSIIAYLEHKAAQRRAGEP